MFFKNECLPALFPRPVVIALAILWGIYALSLGGYFLFPAIIEQTPLGMIAFIPYITALIIHKIGLPFILESNGSCGWGWCNPTSFGWFMAFVVHNLLVWGICYPIVRKIKRSAS